MGNSEVWPSLNIGAEESLYQDWLKSNLGCLKWLKLNTHPVLVNAFAKRKQARKSLHFNGITFGGGVHAIFNHLKVSAILQK